MEISICPFQNMVPLKLKFVSLILDHSTTNKSNNHKEPNFGTVLNRKSSHFPPRKPGRPRRSRSLLLPGFASTSREATAINSSLVALWQSELDPQQSGPSHCRPYPKARDRSS
uniref:Uncharacterized protein n=1 Tax=Arundo donax TaxID=35708 RepID=A0A0A9CTT6_ARUDO